LDLRMGRPHFSPLSLGADVWDLDCDRDCRHAVGEMAYAAERLGKEALRAITC